MIKMFKKGDDKMSNTNTYIYKQSRLDKKNPCVIYGKPIKDGAIVCIIARDVDPTGKVVFVEDNKGNEQSVFKNSLIPINK